MSNERILAVETKNKVGGSVKLAGWVARKRDHGQLIFIDLRDWSGFVQLVFKPENEEIFKTAKEIGSEYVIEVVGTVLEREKDLINENLETGDIEVDVQEMKILNTSKPLPFPIDGTGRDIDENVRLKYRYIDLRRRRLVNILKKKHDFLLAVRNWFNENGFTEVITPLLTSTSPEGARDFLVPSRIYPGKFFVLPQAPQQYKQLLMVGGVDKYFQIAPCLRDEDPRADRHAGAFYQIDIEMSFPTQEKLFQTAENLIASVYSTVSDKEIVQKPFPQISYHDAIDKYGSDKPDVRFDMQINDITDFVKNKTEFNIFNNADAIKCIVVSNGAEFSRSQIKEYEEFAIKNGAKGLAFVKVVDNQFDGGIAKFIPDDVQKEIIKNTKANNNDLIFFGAGKWKETSEILGEVRLKLGRDLELIDNNKLAFIWITGFPFYEINEETGELDFGHNPFSMPKGGIKAFETDDPLKIESYQYDLALNGYEILSGSIRNHDPKILLKAFETIGYSEKEILEKFAGLYNAFQYGAPPHGGWAIGLDRLFMVLIDEPNIRDIYAFPKNSKGVDLVMNAPSRVDKADLDVVHIELKDKGVEVFQRIVEKFEKKNLDFEVMEHEEVLTSEEASQVRRLPANMAIKSLVLKSEEYDDKFIMVCVPANKQLDTEKVSNILGEKFSMATENELFSKTGIKVGAVPPFGRLLGMELYYDVIIQDMGDIVFSAGLRTRSIKTTASNLIELAQPDKNFSNNRFTK